MRSWSLQFNISINGAMVLPSSSSSPPGTTVGLCSAGIAKRDRRRAQHLQPENVPDPKFARWGTMNL